MPKVTAIVSRTTNHISLVQGHEYEVIGIDELSFRIVDESGEPTLHPKSFFLDCEITAPDEWQYQEYGDGEYTYLPLELSSRGFFEDYADGQCAAVQTYREYLQRQKVHSQQ